MNLYEQLRNYHPCNEQETNDRAVMQRMLEREPNVFVRENLTAHFTASSWLINGARDKVLMVWHNLFRSWSWTGGHADGEQDLLSVAVREAREETGIRTITPVRPDIFSLEILTVDGHEKRGVYVPSHLHLNITYLLEADESETLRVKPDENSGVRWFPIKEVPEASCEPWMTERIYRKLNEKLKGEWQ